MTTQTIGSIILISAAIPAVLFVVFYSRVHWERSQMGRQTMALATVIALVLVLSVTRVFLSDSLVYSIIRLVAFALIVPTLWWRLWILVSSWRVGYTPLGLKGGTMQPDGLEADLGTLGDEEYFEHLEKAKAEGVIGTDPDGNLYRVDEKVQDLRGEKG